METWIRLSDPKTIYLALFNGFQLNSPFSQSSFKGTLFYSMLLSAHLYSDHAQMKYESVKKTLSCLLCWIELYENRIKVVFFLTADIFPSFGA